ncbi:MAG: ATP-binding protein [Firmicutes bacterium]|nr:ATP-binding protein [Bacillota bacterium]
MRNEQDIKAKLSDLLKDEKPDYSAILALSNELAQLDSEHVRFSVDAGLINRLGIELVSRQETAVSELVKNAFDADATEVSLKFINTSSLGGSLVISDNGIGMTREQLVDGFMRISSSDKIDNPLSPFYHRKRAGKKGIGRFAVQRLGTKLIILTKSINSNYAYKVTINWDEYENNDNLIEISHTIQEELVDFEHGTTLSILNLRDKWSEAAIRRIYRYVIDIMQPISLSTEVIDKLEDPGFKSTFTIIENGVKKEVIDTSKDISNYAIGEFNGEINSSHLGFYHVKSECFGIDFSSQIGLDPDDITSPFSAIKNVKYKAYYFIYDTALIPKQHLNAIKKWQIYQQELGCIEMGFGFFLMENREMIGCRLICLLAVALFCQRIRIFLFLDL